MNEIADSRDVVFWSSGYDADRHKLIEFMNKCELPEDHPDHEKPPHQLRYINDLEIASETSASSLRRLAQSGKFSKELRKRLNEIR